MIIFFLFTISTSMCCTNNYFVLISAYIERTRILYKINIIYKINHIVLEFEI